jgi:hypothetical protein
MSQESLDFGRLYKVSDGVRAVYRHATDAVDSVGIVVAAGACGIDRGDLRRALDRDGRKLAVEHAIAIAAVSSFTFREQIAQAFCHPLDFKVANAAPPMTASEKAARLETALRALGPVGEQAMRTALGGDGR